MMVTLGSATDMPALATGTGGDAKRLAILLLMLGLLVLKEYAAPLDDGRGRRLRGMVNAAALPFAVVTVVGLVAGLLGGLP